MQCHLQRTDVCVQFRTSSVMHGCTRVHTAAHAVTRARTEHTCTRTCRGMRYQPAHRHAHGELSFPTVFLTKSGFHDARPPTVCFLYLTVYGDTRVSARDRPRSPQVARTSLSAPRGPWLSPPSRALWHAPAGISLEQNLGDGLARQERAPGNPMVAEATSSLHSTFSRRCGGGAPGPASAWLPAAPSPEILPRAVRSSQPPGGLS